MKDKVTINYWNKHKFFKKYKDKTVDTVIYKDNLYYGDKTYEDNITINNFIIGKTIGKHNHSFYNVNSKNIYLYENNKETGINISSKYLINSKVLSLEFNWRPPEFKFANVDVLNIEHLGKIHSIKLIKEELEKINIRPWKDELSVKIENINSGKKYVIDKDGTKESIDYLNIVENNLINGELDLTKYNNFEVISIDKNIIINTLTINKSDINKLRDIKFDDSVYVKNIKIIDNNEMKLNPITIISFEDYLSTYEHIIVGQKENIFIYLNNNNDLKVYNKEEMLKNESILQVDFLKDNGKVVSIIKTSTNYKVIIDEKEYEITKLFKFYLKEVLKNKSSSYKLGIKALENNDFVTFIRNCVSINTFINLYKEYIIFKDNLKRLFKAGFSYEYFMYLHQKGLGSVIINMAQKLDLYKFSEPEIDILNKLGKSYIKK